MCIKNFFSLLGNAAGAGRVFATDDRERGIVISYGYWQRRFQGDRAALGEKVTMNGNLNTIIGVMPRNFHLGEGDADIWRAVSFDDANMVEPANALAGCCRTLEAGRDGEQARRDRDHRGKLRSGISGDQQRLGCGAASA